MRFQGRARSPGTSLGKDRPRDACFGIPSGCMSHAFSMDSDHSLLPKKIRPGGKAPWTPTGGKNITIHGVSVRARRKPRPLSRSPAAFP